MFPTLGLEVAMLYPGSEVRIRTAATARNSGASARTDFEFVCGSPIESAVFKNPSLNRTNKLRGTKTRTRRSSPLFSEPRWRLGENCNFVCVV